MSLLRSSALLVLMLSWLVGCGIHSSTRSAPGSVQLAVHLPAALSSEVARVTVTVSAPDQAPYSEDLTSTEGLWSGVLRDLSSGEHRGFRAQAFTASGALLYTSQVEDVTVTAGSTTLVSLTLQEPSAPSPFSNEAPLIDSLVANATQVSPGRGLVLTARAHDPDSGDTLSYAWTAPTGRFSTPDQATTGWTAPSDPGPVSLTLTVSDARGGAVSLSLTVSVASYTGDTQQEVRLSFNTAPRVRTLTASPSALDVGQTVKLPLSVTDADGDTLSTQWSATCRGGFQMDGEGNTTFVPSERPGTACNNCQVSVVVKDGHGGQTTGSLALCVSLPVAVSPGWITASRLNTERLDPRLTLLSDGRVLASGGERSEQSSEIYDPVKGSWTRSGVMNDLRIYLHTATRLPGGTVLVSGGYTSGGVLSSAEVYAPDTGTWRVTGSMSLRRQAHTATLLPDGKVLIAGGDIGTEAQASAELYDPATSSWAPTGSMLASRTQYTATPLPGGKVLVTGGRTGYLDNVLATAEVYDPATGTWSATGAMSSPRYDHTATPLPGGKVLVVGGRASAFSGDVVQTAEVYDPAPGTWSLTGPMKAVHLGHTATPLPSGRVLVAGGFGSGSSLAPDEVYDPAANTWSLTVPMTVSRAHHDAVLLSTGQVLVSGGVNPSISTRLTTELYTP